MTRKKAEPVKVQMPPSRQSPHRRSRIQDLEKRVQVVEEQLQARAELHNPEHQPRQTQVPPIPVPVPVKADNSTQIQPPPDPETRRKSLGLLGRLL